MDSLIKTLGRIKAMCSRHENDCGDCIYKEKRHIANQEEKYVCVIMEGFEKCFAPDYGILQPTQWKVKELEKAFDGRSV